MEILHLSFPARTTGTETLCAQRMNRAMIPLCNPHISNALSPYDCKMMLPFTTCHRMILIFSSWLLTELFSAPFHWPILQQRLLLSLLVKCRRQTSSSLPPKMVQAGFRVKTSWAHGHQETNHGDDMAQTW